jgi:rhodanese-related sulfurtransferase
VAAIDDLLERARAGLDRLGPEEARDAAERGAVLIDIRSELQRERDGVVPGAVHFPRNVLEWRCDPTSPWSDPRVADPDLRQVVMCDEGYQSSLAAATLKELGLPHATDLAGGFQAWRAAALPVEAAGAAGAADGKEQQ